MRVARREESESSRAHTARRLRTSMPGRGGEGRTGGRRRGLTGQYKSPRRMQGGWTEPSSARCTRHRTAHCRVSKRERLSLRAHHRSAAHASLRPYPLHLDDGKTTEAPHTRTQRKANRHAGTVPSMWGGTGQRAEVHRFDECPQ